jgi:hypothetical protein
MLLVAGQMTQKAARKNSKNNYLQILFPLCLLWSCLKTAFVLSVAARLDFCLGGPYNRPTPLFNFDGAKKSLRARSTLNRPGLLRCPAPVQLMRGTRWINALALASIQDGSEPLHFKLPIQFEFADDHVIQYGIVNIKYGYSQRSF